VASIYPVFGNAEFGRVPPRFQLGWLFLISRDRSRCWDALLFSLTISSFFDDRGSLRETRGPNRIFGSFRFLGCAVKPGSK
jgi:hypothetical protein